ncbi:protein-disulfide reductase DsbD [Halomonas elongata]|uniref:Thiol:disulfide interchange protein DsbD n=1 Tax=Halomonas elongata (strain ATCC 33173 / DSM 2581 / NBRC 15536 / NCIMB 2198 / 1H9) TaxID=768066 RepID=E1VB05_HALED|nr:protein-disulfide reductase DsbD [Halomonas elongata]WBF19338.1 protein-disulfide reductase DsbD [Halomonas elongata]WPU48198.1 protein-disulfide reductase DsbD [Halomonas elongata DSM 2581]CBV42066.2 thiol:disulfide interchange protein DsbD [Halomonas elongata DSM 2581]
MSQLRRLACLVLLLLPMAAQAEWFSSNDGSDFLPVMEAFQPSVWHDGDTLKIGFENADGYYLYRHQFDVASRDPNVTLGELELPPGEAKTDEFLGDVNVYYDRVVLEAPLDTPHQGPLDLTLTFQGCADAGLCYPPETIELQAPEGQAPAAFADWQAPSAGSGTATRSTASQTTGLTAGDAPRSEDGHFNALIRDASLPLVLGLFLLAGLGLTFTPCVLPMVPILSSIIVGQNPSRPRAFALSASYVAGMAITYAVVGMLMGLFGAGLNLQARLQSAPVLIVFAILFGLFALAMFGVFNLRLSPRLASRLDAWQDKAQHSGPIGLALAGALSVLVVSPCVSAPLAGALVFISSTGDALVGGAALLALALGMGIPLLLVGTFGTTLLPRTGPWMNGVKSAFGILLLGVAIWLVARLLPGAVVLLLWAALAIGTALALGALNPGQAQGWPRVRQAAGLLLLTWGITLVIGASRGAQDPLRPLAPAGATLSAASTETAPQEVTVVESLDELQAALAASDQPAMVNVTAEWCISCTIMERDVFPAPRVVAALEGFRRIDVDVTESGETSREVLDHFGLFGPPGLLFFDGNRELREARVQGEIDAPDLATHLREIAAWMQRNKA